MALKKTVEKLRSHSTQVRWKPDGVKLLIFTRFYLFRKGRFSEFFRQGSIWITILWAYSRLIFRYLSPQPEKDAYSSRWQFHEFDIIKPLTHLTGRLFKSILSNSRKAIYFSLPSSNPDFSGLIPPAHPPRRDKVIRIYPVFFSKTIELFKTSSMEIINLFSQSLSLLPPVFQLKNAPYCIR